LPQPLHLREFQWALRAAHFWKLGVGGWKLTASPEAQPWEGCCYNECFPVSPKEPAVKEGIHPKYHEIEARCACGATWKTRSTKPELHLEICNNCHPFFTGRQKLIDTEGRVERFTKRFGAQTSESRKAAQKAAKKPAAATK
jgi:large subunit ribosomal protein L31